MLLSLRSPHVHYASRPGRSQSGWLPSRRSAPGWPPVNSDDATVHRWRQRRSEEADISHLAKTAASGAKPAARSAGRAQSAGDHNARSDRARSLIRTVCAVAGSTSFLDEIDAEANQAGLLPAIAKGSTAPIFDWLLTTFSFQGISDRVARDYMSKHGSATWVGIANGIRKAPTCPKLRSYWAYAGCRYDKGS